MGIGAAILGLGVLSCKKESKTESPPSAKIERSDDRDSALERFRDSLARSTSRRPMTDEEIRALPTEYFGLPFPVGTKIFAGEHSLVEGEPGEAAGFQVPPNKAQDFIDEVLAAWENPTIHGPTYEKPVVTTQQVFDSNGDAFGSVYSDQTAVLRFTNKNPLKKRWIDLTLDPVSGNGILSWTRD